MGIFPGCEPKLFRDTLLGCLLSLNSLTFCCTFSVVLQAPFHKFDVLEGHDELPVQVDPLSWCGRAEFVRLIVDFGVVVVQLFSC